MATRFCVQAHYSRRNHLTLAVGDSLHFLKVLPSRTAQLVLTSPPYNVGKEYEEGKTLEEYLDYQKQVIRECVRITRKGGSICWQVGNHVRSSGDIVPLDIAFYQLFAEHSDLRLRNRIVWHFGHGVHCETRFSPRYETILWYTKGDKYTFNLDTIRVPQKYPGKLAYHGANHGRPSSNPKGKNPGDVWLIPNVKGSHVEKTSHPCQFPIALAENLILALTNRGQLLIDPFLGSGTTAVAALKNGRRAAGVDKEIKYIQIVRNRVKSLESGTLPYRPRNQPIFYPPRTTRLTTPPSGFLLQNRES